MELTGKDACIYVAGHRGLVGSAIVRRLEKGGYTNLLLRTSDEVDLRSEQAVRQLFVEEKPEFIVLAAARVGGILANSRNAVPFLQDNLAIELNVIREAWEHGVKRLLFLGSSCVYPKLAPQPLKEEYLLSGPLEPTNEWYAVAKIAGIKLCEAYSREREADFFSVMPTNLYGPNDNFDLATSHVLPALIRKFHEAKERGDGAPVELWGSGTPRREFLHADDVAAACLFLLSIPRSELLAAAPSGLVNVGVGEDLSIRELAEIIREIVGARNELTFDRSKPDGTPRKLMDVSAMKAMGWEAAIPLKEGIRATYDWFVRHADVAAS